MGKAAKFLYLLAGRLKVLGLLDEYSGAAAAYSLRSLSTSTTNVVKVRRSEDDAELDFTASEVSGGALAAWVVAGGGTEDGFVTTWYDQSGNGNNATQATAANQPKIVSSGTLVTENGKAALDFDGTDDRLSLTYSNLGLSGDTYSVFIGKHDGGGEKYILGHNNRLYQFGYHGSGGYLVYANNSIVVNNYLALSFADNTQILTSWNINGTTHNFYINGSLDNTTVSANVPTSTTGTFYIGYGNNQYYNNIAQEVVIYPSDQSVNRTGIEANINAHYNIYP